MFPSRLKSRFPSALVALLWKAAFNLPSRLFHELLSKNQANHNLPFVKYKMQDLGYSILNISLIVNSIYFLCMCLLRSKTPLKRSQPIKDES